MGDNGKFEITNFEVHEIPDSRKVEKKLLLKWATTENSISRTSEVH
jgi:hypothetical protein